MLDIFQDQGIDLLFLNGDGADFYWINGHGAKDPAIERKFNDEMYALEEHTSDIRKRFVLNGKRVIWQYGNHEDRLNRFVIEKCPAFWNILKLEKMLRFDKNGIEWFPYNNAWQIPNARFKLQHSPPSYSENFAMTALKKKMSGSYMFGCTHRMDFATKTGDYGEKFEIWGNGWLGSDTLSDDHRKVFSYAKRHNNWQTCASIIDVIMGEAIVNQFRVYGEDEKCWAVVNGEYYEG